MDQEKLQELFEEKYQRQLDMTYQAWMAQAPQTEDAAYQELERLNRKIEQLLDSRNINNIPDVQDQIDTQLERLRLIYSLIEEQFGLESKDANW